MNTKNQSITPLSIRLLCAETGNLFKSTRMVGERARQILMRNKRELEEAADSISFDIESANWQRERLAIEFEKRKKPVLEAVDELLAGDLIAVTTTRKGGIPAMLSKLRKYQHE